MFGARAAHCRNLAADRSAANQARPVLACHPRRWPGPAPATEACAPGHCGVVTPMARRRRPAAWQNCQSRQRRGCGASVGRPTQRRTEHPMRTIPEAARSVEVVLETDVLVVGSGPGGLAAALACARAGARTALLDRYGCFGGNITQVGVEGFAWYRHDNRRQRGHRHRVRGAGQGDGRGDARAAIDQLRARRRDVQVRRRRAGAGGRRAADAASPVRGADRRGRRDQRRHHREQVRTRGDPREARRRCDRGCRRRLPRRRADPQDAARADDGVPR